MHFRHYLYFYSTPRLSRNITETALGSHRRDPNLAMTSGLKTVNESWSGHIQTQGGGLMCAVHSMPHTQQTVPEGALTGAAGNWGERVFDAI